MSFIYVHICLAHTLPTPFWNICGCSSGSQTDRAVAARHRGTRRSPVAATSSIMQLSQLQRQYMLQPVACRPACGAAQRVHGLSTKTALVAKATSQQQRELGASTAAAAGSADGSQNKISSIINSSSRRSALLAAAAAAFLIADSGQAAASAPSSLSAADIQQLEAEAYAAYADREFGVALDRLAQIVQADPGNARWHEMTAQVGGGRRTRRRCR